MKLSKNLSGIIIVLAVVLVVGFVFINNKNDNNAVIKQVDAIPKDREEIINIESGMTFSAITESVGIDHELMTELYSTAEDAYDLVSLKTGKPIKFTFDHATDELKQVMYQIDTETELFITKVGEDWTAAIKDIDYEIKIKTVSGSIDTSLYESAVAQDVDIRAIIELADVFAWTVDFAMGIRVGDTYKFIFEERYRDGQYVMPGKILAAKFVNDGKTIEGYYYEYLLADDEIEEGYYHPDGQSVQKIFLKNPVNFKYITSGYTTGLRYISAFDISTGHRAIDYAAAIGTPVRAVGDGTVVYAGWNGSYGNFVSLRHNSVYTTNYAHLSKIYVKYGQSVSQSDYIGAVGSTGLSTGPHLHFEMVKNGTKINPLTVELPSDKAIPEDKLEDFKNLIKSWQEQLNG